MAVLGSPSKNTSGAFDQAINFTGISNGSHILTLSATDVAGNVLTTRFNVTVALDTTAPVIMAQLVRDTAPGSTNTDRLTFDPRITGTLTDASQIAAFKAGFDTATSAQFVDVLAQRQADGHFTLSRTQLEQIYGGTLPDGLHQLHLQAKDEYGNLSSVFTLSFTLDTFTPAPSNLKLAPESDSGQSHYDTITRINTPIITGQAEVGAQVSLYDGNQMIGSATTSADGTWQITTTALTNGTHAISVAIATDIAGNVSPLSQALTLTIDALPPQLTFTTPIDAAPLKNNAKLAGTIDGTGSAITALSYHFDAQADIPLTFNSSGAFNQAFDFTGMSNGAHTLTVTAIDLAGNVLTTQYNVVVALDHEAPIITAQLVRDTAPGGTNTDRITFDPGISGTVTDTNQIVSFRAGFDTTPIANFVDVIARYQADGSFTFSRSQLEAIYGGPLPDGFHSLNLQAQDAFGNRSGLFTLTFTFDTTVLAPSNLQLAAGSDSGQNDHDLITRINTPTIAGKADPKTLVQLYDGSQMVGQATASDTGTWQITSTQLTNGTHVLTAIATDVAGNISPLSQSLTITIDALLPSLTLTTPLATTPLTLATRLVGSLDGTGSAVASLSYQFDQHSAVPVVLNGAGAFDQSFDLTGLTNGSHSLKLTATDLAGNVSIVPYTVTVTLDVTPPLVTAMLAQDTAPGGSTNTDGLTADPTISGTITDASRVVAVWARFDSMPSSAATEITALLQADGRFTLDRAQLAAIYGGVLPDGLHVLHLQAADEYGNRSSPFAVAFTLDTTAPAAPVFNLDRLSDSGVLGDWQTGMNQVTLVGQTDANVVVTLEQTGAVVIADSEGHFTFQGVALELGANALTLRSMDAAGNQTTFQQTITRVPATFDSQLTGWSTTQTGGSTTGSGGASSERCEAVLREGDSFAVTFSRTFQMPATAATLTFTFSDLVFDPTGTRSIKDAFEAVLVDSQGNSLVQTIGPGREACFNLTEGQPLALGSGTTINGQTVTVNLAGVAPGTTFRLLLRLVNNDRDTNTTVHIQQVALHTDSTLVAPTAAPKLEPTFATVPLDWPALADVSASFTPLYGQTSFNQDTHTLFTQVAVQNVGQYGVDAPLLVGIAHISDPTVRVLQTDGTTPDGLPYYNYSALVSNSILAEGETTGTRTLRFDNPQGVPFTYDLVFLGHLNQAPVLTTVPVTEALAGHLYTYAVGATDPEGQPLTYTLLTQPAGMSLDRQTGKLTWSPTVANVGNQQVTLRVEDDRGNTAAQTFTLFVVEGVPNRPPLFTSVPVVSATVNQAYTYQVTVSDPDADTVTFTLLNGPQGMQLDQQTGRLTWQPQGAQVGLQSVVLSLSDGKGGSATQRFQLQTAMAAGNAAPIITSTPETIAYTATGYTYQVQAQDGDQDALTYSLVAAPSGMTIDAQTGQILWTTKPTDAGTHPIAVQVQDASGGVDVQRFTLAVSSVLPGQIWGRVAAEGSLPTGAAQPSTTARPRTGNRLTSEPIPLTSIATLPAGFYAYDGGINYYEPERPF